MKNFNFKNGLVLFASIIAVIFVAAGFFHPEAASGAVLAFAPAVRMGMQPVAVGDKARISLEEFRASMKRQNIVITPGYLGDDVLLSNGVATGQINFNLTQIQTGNVATSVAQRLKNNDAFLVTDIGIYIGTAVAVAGVSTPVQQASIRLETFPNSLVLTAAAADSIALNALYNGWLSIKEASTTYFETLPLMKYRRVGTAQRGTLLFTASTQIESTWDGPNYGMYPITPQFKMAGNKGYQIQANLPQPITIAQSTTLNIYASIRFSGFLATGGGSFAQ